MLILMRRESVSTVAAQSCYSDDLAVAQLGPVLALAPCYNQSLVVSIHTRQMPDRTPPSCRSESFLKFNPVNWLVEGAHL